MKETIDMTMRKRAIKLLAALGLMAPALNQLVCTTTEIQDALASGIETFLEDMFANVATDVANGVSGADG